MKDSKISFMEEGNIFFQVLLFLLQNPLFEIDKVKMMCIVYIFPLKPVHKIGEVFRHFRTRKYSVYHMTTK